MFKTERGGVGQNIIIFKRIKMKYNFVRTTKFNLSGRISKNRNKLIEHRHLAVI